MNVTFCSVSSTAVGIKAFTRVRRELLPETRDRLLPIAGRRGAYDFGFDFGALEIPCQFEVFADSASELRTNARTVAAWLNNEGVLSFEDEDVQYVARPIGKVTKDIIGNDGVGRVNFFVPDGYAHATSLSYSSSTGADGYTNSGLETPVEITVQMTSSATDLTVTITPSNEYIKIVTAIGSTEEIVINTNTHKVNIGSSDAREYVTFGSEYFYIPSNSTFDITVDSTSATVSYNFRERY